MTANIHQKLLWLDLETTGLNPLTDSVLELGLMVTDEDLEVLATHRWVFSKSSVPGDLDIAVLDMHFANGLFKECLTIGEAPHHIALEVDNFIEEHFPLVDTKNPDTLVPLVGNSVHFDHQFLQAMADRREGGGYWSQVIEKLHYRHIDISSLKLLFSIYRDGDFKGRPEDRKAHRVLPDLEDSRLEALYYFQKLGWVSPQN